MNLAPALSFTVNNNGSVTYASFPPIKNESKDFETSIRDAVWRSTTFTSKFVGKCELSNTMYSEEDSGLRIKKFVL